MTFPTGCPTCDTLGPELPTILNNGALTLHRALHDTWHTIALAVKDWLTGKDTQQ